MNIKNYLDDNKIEQIYVSEALNDNRNTFLKNIIINEYSDTTKNTLFWGMYERSDIIKIICHKGKKWIFWGGNDANIKIPRRLQIVKLMKKLDIENHIILNNNDYIENNLNLMNIKPTKLMNDSLMNNNKTDLNHSLMNDSLMNNNKTDLNDSLMNNSLMKNFKNNKIKAYLQCNFDNTIFKNVSNILYTDKQNADIAFIEKYDHNLIKYFGLQGKVVFTKVKCDYPNCIFFDDIKLLSYKIGYFYYNTSLYLKNDIKESVRKYINNEYRLNTIVYIPVWGRHNLLKECIDSIKNQTEKCIILGICSNTEDSEYLNSLNITNIITLNKPLGIKFQFGIEFCKFFYPKNVIIMGSDDIMTSNYIENINKYINKYDVIGLRNWQIKEIPNNDLYNIKYNHPITLINNIKYWGGVSSKFFKLFDIKCYGFETNKLKFFPFTIGAGRSIGYDILNKVNWQIYQDLESCLDTVSLFKLLMIKNATYITLESNSFNIISLKDSSLDMITPKEKYMNSKNLLVDIKQN